VGVGVRWVFGGGVGGVWGVRWGGWDSPSVHGASADHVGITCSGVHTRNRVKRIPLDSCSSLPLMISTSEKGKKRKKGKDAGMMTSRPSSRPAHG